MLSLIFSAVVLLFVAYVTYALFSGGSNKRTSDLSSYIATADGKNKHPYLHVYLTSKRLPSVIFFCGSF